MLTTLSSIPDLVCILQVGVFVAQLAVFRAQSSLVGICVDVYLLVFTRVTCVSMQANKLG